MAVSPMVAHQLPLGVEVDHREPLDRIVADDPAMLALVNDFGDEHSRCKTIVTVGYASESVILWCDDHRELVIQPVERG